MSPVEILQNIILEKEGEIQKLYGALRVLKDALPNMPAEPSAPPQAPLPVEIPEKTAEPAPSLPKPIKPRGPVCGACGAGMYPTFRTMPSGAMVQLLKCNDSACGNESYQS